MEIVLDEELEKAIRAVADAGGVTVEQVVHQALWEHLSPRPEQEPRDEWERAILSIGKPCGVSLSDEQVSRECLYD